METTESKIEYHKSILKKLTEQLINTKDFKEESLINEKIKTQQEFLESLYAILNNLNEKETEKEESKNVSKKNINVNQNNTNKKDKYNNNSQIKKKNNKNITKKMINEYKNKKIIS